MYARARTKPVGQKEREKKIMIEVYGEEKKMLEFKAAPKKKKYMYYSTFTQPGSAADVVSVFL